MYFFNYFIFKIQQQHVESYLKWDIVTLKKFDNMAVAILDAILNFLKSYRWIFGDF